MPITYKCDNCDVTADSLGGWYPVVVGFLHEEVTAPGGRVLEATAPQLIFHVAACRDAWCVKAGVAPPASPAPPA